MAEDQSEPGSEGKPANLETLEQSDKTSKKQIENLEPGVATDEKIAADDLDKSKELKAEKEMHKNNDDDGDDKSDQSTRLVIDVPETKENEEPKPTDGEPDESEEQQEEKRKAHQVVEEKPKVNAVPSKIDDNDKEVVKESNECEAKTENVSVGIKSKRSKDDDNVENSAEDKAKKTIKKSATAKDDDTAVSKDKIEKEDKDTTEQPEVGIVGMPTAASELLSEEELATEKSALSTDGTKSIVSERVVRWVEKTTSKADVDRVVTLTIKPVVKPAEELEEDDDEEMEDEEEEIDDVEEEEEEEDSDGCKIQTRSRKRKQSNGTNGTGGPSTRKSQKVVSSIIRRSIRW